MNGTVFRTAHCRTIHDNQPMWILFKQILRSFRDVGWVVTMESNKRSNSQIRCLTCRNQYVYFIKSRSVSPQKSTEYCISETYHTKSQLKKCTTFLENMDLFAKSECKLVLCFKIKFWMGVVIVVLSSFLVHQQIAGKLTIMEVMVTQFWDFAGKMLLWTTYKQ